MGKMLRKELKLYRGTLAEIKANPTEDMAIYLAWDTREIYVGNALGVKVLYNGGENLTAQQVRDLVGDEVGDVLDQIRNLLTQNNSNYINVSSRVTNIENTVNTFNNSLDSRVTQSVNQILANYEEETLGDLYFNKTETQELVQENNLVIQAEIKNLRDNVFTKLEIETLIPTDIASNIEFQEFRLQVIPYLSVKLIETIVTHNMLLSLGNGAYYATQGNFIIIKNGTAISRLSATGIVESYIGGAWSRSIDNSVILSVNNIQPTSNNVSLNADDIPDTNNRKWSNLIPDQTSLAINPKGRRADFEIGEKSISIGAESYATEDKTISLGYNAANSGMDSIQIGEGFNGSNGVLQVWQHKLLDKETGYIPQERLGFMQTVIAVIPSDWNTITNKYIAEIQGITSNSIIWVSPDTSSSTNFLNYIEFEVRAVQQSSGLLVFECTTIPTSTLSINVLWRV
jgi:hypothetical protein